MGYYSKGGPLDRLTQTYGGLHPDKAPAGYGAFKTTIGSRVPTYQSPDGTIYELATGRPVNPEYMGTTDRGYSGFTNLPLQGDPKTWSGPVATLSPTPPEPLTSTPEPPTPPTAPPDPTTTGEDPRASERDSNGIPAKGTITGMKPMNIPEISINPFELTGLTESALDAGYEAGLPGSGDAEVSAKNAEITPTQEQIGTNAQKIAPESADPQVEEAAPTAEVPIDWLNRGPSLDNKRAQAIYNAPRGSGPMGMRNAINEAMGMADELDDTGRMTGRTYINNAQGEPTLFDDSAEGSKMARNNYLDDPQKFLAGVMSGDVVLGGQNGTQLEEQSEGTLDATQTPTDTAIPSPLYREIPAGVSLNTNIAYGQGYYPGGYAQIKYQTIYNRFRFTSKDSVS